MQPKGKGIGVMIAFGRPKGDAPPALDSPGMGMSKRNDAQETPEMEHGFHDKGEPPRATPESVDYRTESETCRACEYNSGGECSFLSIPVSDGDSCKRFEAKSEDEGVEHDMGGKDLEGSSDTEDYAR